jgi:hypothetical protein
MFCRLLFVSLSFFLLAIVLSFLLRLTDSDYPSGILKLLLHFYGICVCLRIAVSSAYRVVFFALFVFVLCTQCCQFLWIVHSWCCGHHNMETFDKTKCWTSPYDTIVHIHFLYQDLSFTMIFWTELSAGCLIRNSNYIKMFQVRWFSGQSSTQCCQFLWIVHSWLPLRFSLTFIRSTPLTKRL